MQLIVAVCAGNNPLCIVRTNIDRSHGLTSTCHATVVNVKLTRHYHGDHGGQSTMNIKTATCNLTFLFNTISLLYIDRTNVDWSHGRKSMFHFPYSCTSMRFEKILLNFSGASLQDWFLTTSTSN
jgi:hypothetical protein